MLARQTELLSREIVHRTRGLTGGPITRLMSPSDLGHVIKPFVFLDLAVFEEGEERTPMEYLWHPHSGIATVTVILEGAIRFAETTGRTGVLSAGGIEWMRAGKGLAHRPGRARTRARFPALGRAAAGARERPEPQPVHDARRGTGRKPRARGPRDLRRRGRALSTRLR